MKRWIAVLLVALMVLAGGIASGPYVTIRAIRSAVQAQDASALAAQVDFPMLRANLKAQLSDALVREAGEDVQANPLGAIALSLATGAVGGVVDVLVTPTGLAGVMEGRKVWRNARGGFRRQPPAFEDAPGRRQPESATPPAPLQDARYRFESLSRFTATVQSEDGEPIVFVLQRNGLRWRLVDIRLPLAG